MVYTILNNMLIIVLTITGVFHCRVPELFIALAVFLVVLNTYESLDEGNVRGSAFAKLILMTLFSVTSGNFTGFLVFAAGGAGYVHAVIGMGLFIISEVFSENVTPAICIVKALILAAAFLFIMCLHYLIGYIKRRKALEQKRLVASNVSEMHEKRLNEQLVVQNFLAEKNARLIERENISRNIHNSVGHSITAAIMTLDAADMLYEVKPDDARRKMNDANGRIRESLESIRRAVRIIDEESTEMAAGDLKCEMENVINEFVTDTSICVDRCFENLQDDIRIPYDHAVFLTGALQEMLTNGVKHGNADEFAVILIGDRAHIRLEVADNGESDFGVFNKEQRIEKGFGVKKMISYVKKSGGKTEFVNEGGFKGIIEIEY